MNRRSFIGRAIGLLAGLSLTLIGMKKPESVEAASAKALVGTYTFNLFQLRDDTSIFSDPVLSKVKAGSYDWYWVKKTAPSKVNGWIWTLCQIGRYPNGFWFIKCVDSQIEADSRKSPHPWDDED